MKVLQRIALNHSYRIWMALGISFCWQFMLFFNEFTLNGKEKQCLYTIVFYVLKTTNIWSQVMPSDSICFLCCQRVKTSSKISNRIQIVGGIFSEPELQFQKYFTDLSASEKKISGYTNLFNCVIEELLPNLQWKWFICNKMTCLMANIKRT